MFSDAFDEDVIISWKLNIATMLHICLLHSIQKGVELAVVCPHCNTALGCFGCIVSKANQLMPLAMSFHWHMAITPWNSHDLDIALLSISATDSLFYHSHLVMLLIALLLRKKWLIIIMKRNSARVHYYIKIVFGSISSNTFQLYIKVFCPAHIPTNFGYPATSQDPTQRSIITIPYSET